MYPHEPLCSLYFITSGVEEGQGSVRFPVCELMLRTWPNTLRREQSPPSITHAKRRATVPSHTSEPLRPQTRTGKIERGRARFSGQRLRETTLHVQFALGSSVQYKLSDCTFSASIENNACT